MSKGFRKRHIASLAAGAAVAALAMNVAQAQSASGQAPAQVADNAQDSDSQVETVVVTGTQIRGTQVVGSSVINIDRAQITETGATTINEILQQQPQIFNFGITDTQRNGTGGAGNITYANSVNLRGLSPFATLTLVDNHRAPASGTLGAAVDPSVIPTIMLQGVSIIADGASATYGSDAIAGVVNLSLRRNFEGIEATARDGVGNHYDEHQFDVIVGHQWDTGQITIGAEDSYHSSLSGLYRSYYTSNQTAYGGSDFRVTNCNPGTIELNGTTYAIPTGGVTPATAGTLVAGTSNKCDPLKSEDLLPEQGRYDVAMTFDQSITSWLSVYGDAYFARRDFEREAPIATGPLVVTNANPYFVAPPGTGATSETVDYSFGGQGLGDVAPNRGYSVNEQVTVGFHVALWGDWDWQTYGSYGYNHDESGVPNGDGFSNYTINASSPQVAAALASTNPATALNLFGSNSTALLKSLNNNIFVAPGIIRQRVVESKVDGTLFKLSGGDVKVALGVQYEADSLDDGVASGTAPPLPPINWQHLHRDETALYGEIYVPIVGQGNAMPGVQALDLDMGIRYTNYTVVGSTVNPKFGADWTVNDELKIRGSYGTSFRAPALSELVGPVTAVFVQTYSTPTGPVAGYTLGGGNTGLKPETAVTWSLGGDWTPSFIDNFKLTLNYFDISYKNQVSSYLSNLNLLQNPSKYASLITNCPSVACTAMINQYVTGPNHEPVFGPILPSPAVFVNGLEQNLATTRTSGIDFQAFYSYETQNTGTFNFGLGGTYFTQFEESPVPSSPISNELNRIGFPLRFRFRANAGWNMGPWNTMLFLNYANAYLNDESTPVQDVPAYATVDLHVAYNFGALEAVGLSNWKVSLDVTNLFDSAPPYVNIIPNPNGGGGFDPQNANPIGRVVALSLDAAL